MDTIQIYQQARKSRDPRFDGQFYVAVKSTGIFCRPICPAPSPKEENVEYYQLAPLAMQAGFRPCLRCRPDSAPGSCAWKGTTTTLERGIKLLRAHPELTVLDICGKLGVSDRYLRELFQQKLGISPKKFRLFDQLLIAKNLLHNSELSIEDVAIASGFSSARRLQAHMHATLQLTPTQIRKNGRTKPFSLNKSEAASLHIQLAYRAPYNWTHLRDFLKLRAIAGIETVTENSYTRSLTYGTATGVFTATHNSNRHCFDIELSISDLSCFQGVVLQIRRLLDLDCDPQVIYSRLLATGLPQNVIASGIRIPGVWSVFEASCRAVLGQQISVKAAVNLVSQLAQELGGTYNQLRLFPTPEAIAESDLSFLKMPDKRRQCLRDLATFYSQKGEWQDMQSIKGIGPWTVAYAEMRGLSNPDIWLDSDLIIKKQIQQHSLTPQDAAPWRSYLTFQLWNMA
ncbi:AlkA N-terminal domain-containing protein [Aliiglaciecola sp. 3_MG-2023]|uniref:DNA-3-methyladenine glycosylase 2 family protein n=1 Tax=Aliiglaciecola sp. 3_MG-2023 TaxID=3062644 RepID=UPI0026E18E84|nr:AlkA N-terminal domain-containing protein [Aliiglaciecola sp. 3_MG-2023]MDO6695246.1 AlkA N-terminal domain-containing protein [Aliiglaciecola sp. 3_MG-2023]